MSRKDDSVEFAIEVRSADGEMFPIDMSDVTSPYDFVETVVKTSEPGETVVLFEIRNGVKKPVYQASV